MAIAEAAAAEQPIERGWMKPRIVAPGQQVELAVAILALAAEAGLLVAAASRLAPLPLLLLGHVVLCGGLLLLVAARARAGINTIPSLLVALLTLVAGPIGAGIALLGLLLGNRTRPRPELLDQWYDRISMSQQADPVQQLCDRVAIGRAIDLVAPKPRAFEEVVTRGTIAERQTALGLIARSFSPEYASALRAALKSEEPVIRVQAAAVAARVREGLERRLTGLLRSAEISGLAPAEALRLAGDISGCIASGLLDESTAARAERTVARLQEGAFADGAWGLVELSPVLTALRRRGGAGAVRRMATSLENELIRSGQFARLRGLRRMARVIAGGRRVRARGPIRVRHGGGR